MLFSLFLSVSETFFVSQRLQMSLQLQTMTAKKDKLRLESVCIFLNWRCLHSFFFWSVSNFCFPFNEVRTSYTAVISDTYFIWCLNQQTQNLEVIYAANRPINNILKIKSIIYENSIWNKTRKYSNLFVAFVTKWIRYAQDWTLMRFKFLMVSITKCPHW